MNSENMNDDFVIEDVKQVEKKQFYGQKALRHVRLSPDVRAIESWAFANCAALSVLELSKKCSISLDAFLGCKNLKQIKVIDADLDSDLSYLLAMLFVNFPEYPMYDISDVGTDTWRMRIDERIKKELELPFAHGFNPFPAGGEEDYEGAENDIDCYINQQKRIRCKLLYERLLYSAGPAWMHSYLSSSDVCVEVLVEEALRQKEYYKIFCELKLVNDENIEIILEKCKAVPELAAMILADIGKQEKKNIFDEFQL